MVSYALAHDEVSIETPEHVNISYELAGPGSRLLAAMLDHFILGLSAFAAVLLAWAVYRELPSFSASLTVIVVALAAPLLLLVVYFVTFELLWNGQTPGKRVAGLRVMRDDGTPAAPIDLIIRNTVRIVDFLPYLYFAGGLVAFVHRQSKRLGDIAAGTVVVKLRQTELPQIVAASPSLDGPPDHLTAILRPAARSITAEERATVERFLARRWELAPDVRAAMSRRIAEVLRVKLPAEIASLADQDPEPVLEALARACAQTAERL